MNMTFSNETIYKDLMKSVHPDLHPDMKDANEKAKKVNGLKNNPPALRLLAIEWGFIIPTSEDYKNILRSRSRARTAPRVSTQRTDIVLNVGDGVRFRMGRFTGLTGVVVDKGTIHSREFYGYASFVVYNPINNKFIRTKIRHYNRVASYFTKIEISHTVKDDAIRKWNTYNTWENKPIKSLSDLGLNPNCNYMNFNIKVKIRLYNNTYYARVKRTTAKCVIVDYYGFEKLIRLSNIIERKD